MEYHNILIHLFEPGDLLALLIASRIAARCHDYTDRRARFPFQLNFVQSLIHDCLQNCQQVVFHAEQDALGLGVAEPCIIF